MPSVLHEVLIDLFRHRPQLVAELLPLVTDTPLPEFDNARLESGDCPDIDPTEYRADAVVVLASGTHPELAVVVEVQLRPDPDKRWSWPVYLTTLRARLRCGTVLLVMCPDDRTAAHCRRPIHVAPGFTLVPVVMRPSDVPVVTDAVIAAENPELAVLSAIAHRNDPARRFLESLMNAGTYKYKSEFARRYFDQGEAQGEAKGEANALLAVLRSRGIAVDADIVDLVETSARIGDIGQLDEWLEKAATAESADQVFGV